LGADAAGGLQGRRRAEEELLWFRRAARYTLNLVLVTAVPGEFCGSDDGGVRKKRFVPCNGHFV
jgi:hypothetical protein